MGALVLFLLYGVRLAQCVVIRKRADEMGRAYEDVQSEYTEQTALKRFVENEDIAAMALFLASAEGRNITGETFNISAGMKV